MKLSKKIFPSNYSADGQLRCSITITNPTQTNYHNLSLYDNLGVYNWHGLSCFPLTYKDDSAQIIYYNSNGYFESKITYKLSGKGIVFFFSIPSLCTALLSFDVYVSPYAPLDAGSHITTTAALHSNLQRHPLTAAHRLPVSEKISTTISCYSQPKFIVGKPTAISYIVSNYGNIPTDKSNSIIISNQITPPLTNVTVTANNIPWKNGEHYVYDESHSLFQTQSEKLTLDCARFVQDHSGRWITIPSSVIIRVVGTVTPRAIDLAHPT